VKVELNLDLSISSLLHFTQAVILLVVLVLVLLVWHSKRHQTSGGTNCLDVCAAPGASGKAFPATTTWQEFEDTESLYIADDATVKAKYGKEINCWDVPAITSMYAAFYEIEAFDEPLDCWNTGSILLI
jgi:hypothetical protein